MINGIKYSRGYVYYMIQSFLIVKVYAVVSYTKIIDPHHFIEGL